MHASFTLKSVSERQVSKAFDYTDIHQTHVLVIRFQILLRPWLMTCS